MLWVFQDIITQYVIGFVLCFIIFLIWKVTNKGQKL